MVCRLYNIYIYVSPFAGLQNTNDPNKERYNCRPLNFNTLKRMNQQYITFALNVHQKGGGI